METTCAFLSTLSLRRATLTRKPCCAPTAISIHALLAESDLHCKTPITFRHYFYPRSPCGERLNSSYGALDGASISIHALLAESDTFLYFLLSGHLYFYPRSPCGERQQRRPQTEKQRYFYPRSPCGERLVRVVLLPEPFLPFLSTLSLRRATCYSFRHSASCWHFYPRSPCGERRKRPSSVILRHNFYPRSPCGERPPPPFLASQTR